MTATTATIATTTSVRGVRDGEGTGLGDGDVMDTPRYAKRSQWTRGERESVAGKKRRNRD